MWRLWDFSSLMRWLFIFRVEYGVFSSIDSFRIRLQCALLFNASLWKLESHFQYLSLSKVVCWRAERHCRGKPVRTGWSKIILLFYTAHTQEEFRKQATDYECEKTVWYVKNNWHTWVPVSDTVMGWYPARLKGKHALPNVHTFLLLHPRKL